MHSAKSNATGRLRVLLIDDHPVVLAGLRSFLRTEPEFDVVGQIGTNHESAARARKLKPDALLLTLSAAIERPGDCVQSLKRELPEAPIVVLCLDARVREDDLIKAGATTVLPKDSGRDEILNAMHALRGGDETGPRRLGRRASSHPPAAGSLSRRELQVLTLIAEGFTNKQIADRLGISVRTVETHRERLMRKLDVQGTAALTKAAITLGLVNARG